VTPSAGDQAWGAGTQVLDVPLAVTPSVAAYDRAQTVQVRPTAPAGATHFVVELLNGRGRVHARVDVASGVNATLGLGDVDTPHAEIRAHAFDASGALLG
jgi:hypothetical protein